MNLNRDCNQTLSSCLPCSLKADDPFQVNAVFTAVWNCMGLYPLIWASILVPGGRGEGKVGPSCCLQTTREHCLDAVRLASPCIAAAESVGEQLAILTGRSEPASGCREGLGPCCIANIQDSLDSCVVQLLLWVPFAVCCPPWMCSPMLCGMCVSSSNRDFHLVKISEKCRTLLPPAATCTLPYNAVAGMALCCSICVLWRIRSHPVHVPVVTPTEPRAPASTSL